MSYAVRLAESHGHTSVQSIMEMRLSRVFGRRTLELSGAGRLERFAPVGFASFARRGTSKETRP